MQTCWDLAQRWYTGRAERDWQRPNAQAVFAGLGLTGPFWDLGA